MAKPEMHGVRQARRQHRGQQLGDTEQEQSLRTGRFAAVLEDTPSAAFLSQTAGNGQYFEMVNYPPINGGPYGIGIAKDDPQLGKAIQAAMQQLMTNGVYGKIVADWGTDGRSANQRNVERRALRAWSAINERSGAAPSSRAVADRAAPLLVAMGGSGRDPRGHRRHSLCACAGQDRLCGCTEILRLSDHPAGALSHHHSCHCLPASGHRAWLFCCPHAGFAQPGGAADGANCIFGCFVACPCCCSC